MKQKLLFLTLVGICAASMASAQVVLDETTISGDFTPDADDSVSPGEFLSDWLVGGGRNAIVGSSTDLLGRPAGSSDRFYRAERRRDLTLDTGYQTAGFGEEYLVSLYLRGQDPDVGPEDFLEFTIFYTDDNTIGGARQDEIILQFFPDNPGTATNFTNQTAAASFTSDPGAGKNLFFYLTTDDTLPTNATNDAFIDVDRINVSVVPEPSSFALIAGMFGLTWVMLRRRS